MNFFITGTDTNAGKTFCTALLTRALRGERL
jgi:dethiobiotin synthetase